MVQSLAKWKRVALKRYELWPGKGIYADMNAIRRDEDELDNLHSVYVDQWDWEKVILPGERNIDYLKSTVHGHCRRALRHAGHAARHLPRALRPARARPPRELRHYPGARGPLAGLTPKERENAYVKEHPTTFIMGIGAPLKSGRPHDGRSPDYDDWSLNGDILVWDSVLSRAFELSSMGIRVDPESLDRQLAAAGCDDRRGLYYHQLLLNGQLPLSIGGGIGQSRMSMLMLGKCHIGEVQCSVWDDETPARLRGRRGHAPLIQVHIRPAGRPAGFVLP